MKIFFGSIFVPIWTATLPAIARPGTAARDHMGGDGRRRAPSESIFID